MYYLLTKLLAYVVFFGTAIEATAPSASYRGAIIMHAYGQMQDADLVDSLRLAITRVIKHETIRRRTVERIIGMFARNEIMGPGHFPCTNEDDTLFYDLLRNMEARAQADAMSIVLILKLQCVIQRNAEYAEALGETAETVIIRNPRGFLNAYAAISSSERERAISSVRFIYVNNRNSFDKSVGKILRNTAGPWAKEILRKLEVDHE
jgi:hypothetical protein